MSSRLTEKRSVSEGDLSEAPQNHSKLNGATEASIESSDVSNDEKKESSHHGSRSISPHRKRKRDTAGNPLAANMSLSSSSSSSSDDDDQGAKPAEHQTSSSSIGAIDQSTLKQERSLEATIQKGSYEYNLSPDGEPLTQEDPVESDNEEKSLQPQHPHQTDGWRVKLYRLNTDGSWDDCGTGSILCLFKKAALMNSSTLNGDAWVYHELGEPTLCMHSEVKHPSSAVGATPRILLRTRILLRDAYQRQGDNIITWCEPYMEEGNPAQGVDLALSFQDIAGCLDIWRQITQVQSRAAELYRKTKSETNRSHSSGSHGGDKGERAREGKATSSVEDMAHAVAAAHHANLQRQQQQEMWVSVASEAAQHHLDHQNSIAERNQDHHFEGEAMMASYHDPCSGPQSVASITAPSIQLPNPPGLTDLEQIADTIAAVQVCLIFQRPHYSL